MKKKTQYGQPYILNPELTCDELDGLIEHSKEEEKEGRQYIQIYRERTVHETLPMTTDDLLLVKKEFLNQDREDFDSICVRGNILEMTFLNNFFNPTNWEKFHEETTDPIKWH